MKKIISFFISIMSVFIFSLTVFAIDEPIKFFKVSKTEKFSADYIVSYAHEKGFNGILIDLKDSGSLEFYYSIKALAGSELKLYLMGDYDVISNVTDCILVADTSVSEDDFRSLSEKQGKEKLGVFLEFDNEEALLKAKKLYKDELFSIIFAENLYSSHSEFGYEEYSLEIASQFQGAKLITLNNLKKVRMPVIEGDYYEETFELNSQYLVNKLNGFGFCVDDFTALMKDRYYSASYLTSFFESKVLDENANFSVSKKFNITRPTGSSLTIDTNRYTIFGTSDPTKPLYMDGKEIERTSKSGLFAINVDVPKNGKAFTFSQGDISRSITLSRSSDSSSSSGTTKNLSSCYPSATAVIGHDESEITLSCVAPSGGNVSAKINGKTVKLKQVAAANNGIPAKFTGTYTLTDTYPNGEVISVGRVTYVLNYNGTTKTKESSGAFYYVGKDASFAVKANANLAGVEIEPSDQGLYVTTLRSGCVDYVTEISENGWFKISCGGYIKPSHCDIITGKTDITANIASVEKEKGANYEKLNISCDNFPSFKGEIIDKALVLTLYNVDYKDISSIDLDFELMRRIVAVDNGDKSVTLNFYSTEKLWGWDIFTDNEKGTFSVIIKGTPKLSDIPEKPLNGITVTVCSGHGGIDPGALSVAGEKGVNEAQINLANSLMMIESLENLGATVVPLIEYSGKLDTYGRTDPARYAYSDIYICCHANSVAENADANKWCGTYVYYHYSSSNEFATKLCDYISEYTHRDNEGTEEGYYSVTRLTMCPAVMLEVGFVSNPKEVDSLIDQRNIQKTALAVTRAVLEILDN